MPNILLHCFMLFVMINFICLMTYIVISMFVVEPRKLTFFPISNITAMVVLVTTLIVIFYALSSVPVRIFLKIQSEPYKNFKPAQIVLEKAHSQNRSISNLEYNIIHFKYLIYAYKNNLD
jgi:uncharacterized membrane protein